MSSNVALRAAKGFLWSVMTGLGTRVLGVVGTVYLTYLIDPATMGEVANAHASVLLAHTLTGLGVTQFLIVGESKAGEEDIDTGHVTLIFLGTGLAAFGVLTLLREPLGAYLHSPGLPRYLPGLALAMAFDRIGNVPERILAKELDFRIIGMGRVASELSYTGVSVALARAGYGGMAVVWANVARSVLYAVAMAWPVRPSRWLRFSAPSLRRWGEIVRLGVPYWINHALILIARVGDNLVIARAFTPEIVGLYNQAYNVADIPATQVGEQVADVFFPSVRLLAPHERPAALIEALSLLALVVFPLSVGLAAVAPILVGTVLPARWQGVAPFLALLSVLGVVRPVGWSLAAYLQGAGEGRAVVQGGASLVIALFAFMPLLTAFGPYVACLAVGLTFATHAAVCAVLVRRIGGPRVGEVLRAVGGPLLACAPMFAAVRAVTHRGESTPTSALLLLGIAVGAAVYAAAAALFARGAVLRVAAFARALLAKRHVNAS
jgi:PST family polysaccharide transporter